MIDIIVIGGAYFRSCLNLYMTVVEDPAHGCHVVGYIVDLVEGAFFCVMADKARFIDDPEVCHHPDIDLPAEILPCKIADAQQGGDPSVPLDKTDEVSRYDACQRDQDRYDQQ